jgi:hypothetical protein
MTALMISIASKNEATTAMLVERGADLNLADTVRALLEASHKLA